MKCPTCLQEMPIKSKDVSNNQKKDNEYREYKRILYWCEKDDVWISVEIPNGSSKHLALKQVLT